MAIGGILGMEGIHLPMIESGIAASVLVLGLLVAFAVRMPVSASAFIAAVFAILHGYAHGTEIPASASGITYAAGFLAATALLNCAGIGLGVLIQRGTTAPLVRFAGAAIAVVGLAVAIG